MEKKNQEPTPKKKIGLLKAFFRQYFEELSSWSEDVRLGWFCFFPLIAGAILFIVELVRTYVITTNSAFFATLFLSLFKGAVFALTIVLLVALMLAVYTLIGLVVIRFLTWVKSE